MQEADVKAVVQADVKAKLKGTAAQTAAGVSHWPASLQLQLQQGERGTRLTRNRHHGPLYVQKPFYPEGPDLPHLYILHPPGGLVSGDRLQLQVNLERNASALLTTPGAGRVYRARSDRALQYQVNHLQVADGASLEWLPLESIIFPDARTRLETRVELQGSARFMGWEVTSLGLPACGERFDRGELSQRLQISRDGQPLLVEQLQLNDRSRRLYSAAAGLQSKPISGLFVAGPFTTGQIEPELMDSLRRLPDDRGREYLAAISLSGEFILGRYLGQCSEQARVVFEYWWQLLRPGLLQRQACRPRIWST